MSEHTAEKQQPSQGDDAVIERLMTVEVAPLSLVAYRVGAPPLHLVPAPGRRSWMESTSERFANRCLPLLIANQAGWFVLNSHTVRATWTGEDHKTGLHIEYLSGTEPYPAVSHFGYGILTWTLPYLFRTPPGYNLLVRGPSNWPKDGVYPLEGIVEADWAAATFTMNWKLTCTDRSIQFNEGEPICMIVPQRRGELERFQPKAQDIQTDPETYAGYEHWRTSRDEFLNDLNAPESEAVKQAWQKDYFRGKATNSLIAPEHQLKLKLREFIQE